MGARARYDDAAISENSAVVMARLNDRLLEMTRAIQQRLIAEIAELRDDSALVELLGASVQGNVDTFFMALRYEIPIENIEPPTAALEYSRRMAQRGVPMNALVRAYRLGHEMVLEFARDEINNAGLDPRMSLAVFERMTAVTFRYVDWISQEVVVEYERERERWLENRNSVRAVRVREVLEATDVDLDAITAAIRYPMRRIHLGLVLWLPEADGQGDELVRWRGFLRELTESLQTQGSSLFVAADRVSGWGWIPLHPAAAGNGGRRRSAVRRQLRRLAVGCARVAAARRRRVPAVAQAGAARAERSDRRRSRRGVGHRSRTIPECRPPHCSATISTKRERGCTRCSDRCPRTPRTMRA